MQAHNRILFVGTALDKSYLQQLKSVVGTTSVALLLESPSTFTELDYICQAKKATAIISTSPSLLEKLVNSQIQGAGKKLRPSIDNYAGSLFTIPTKKLECVFIPPLEQLVTVPYGKFLTRRYISKLTTPEVWVPSTEFKWSIYDEATYESILERFKSAEGISCDIETFKSPPSIRCVGFTALYYSKQDGWTSESLVIPCTSSYNLTAIRTILHLPIPKIFQNGKYDISYLQAYNSAPTWYLWDTAQFFHSWYSELPKDLASLNSFFVRASMYWKDLAQTSDLHEYYKYNALDTWATANVFLAWMAEAPQWARANYANTFPLQYPCHMAEMVGIARDMKELRVVNAEQKEVVSKQSESIDRMLGVTGFNVASTPQMRKLLGILGCSDLTSADEKNLIKAAGRHPLNARIIGSILAVRKARKLISTYITEGKEFYGHLAGISEAGKPSCRILFSLNPHGTDTGRLASREHHFWCGLQIQNIPRGIAVKRTLIADPRFLLAECDLEQAESRDTAYISGDKALIAAVSGEQDFHSVNASAFFGIPYDSIYDDRSKKTRNKAIRDLAKRVNHGANYGMGYRVLIDTMGEEKIWEAKKLLNLPARYMLKDVAEYLLARFHKTYQALAKIFYAGVVQEIALTSKLESKAMHHPDWAICKNQKFSTPYVRHCFSDPSKSKHALNSYIAHVPQSLNAKTLNAAYMKVFYEIAIHEDYSSDFKLGPQIHDSILFQFRAGHESIATKVKQCMEIPVTITGYDGVVREFTVPVGIKAGSDNKGAHRWSETE